jgi:V/A-type H+-transporting ATPase subunit D
MAQETIRPTRLELLRTKRRINLARRGLKLLKLKRSALIVEFFKIARQAAQLRGDLAQRIAQGYRAIRQAEMMEGPVRLENISLMLPQVSELQVKSRNVMGVRTPTLVGEEYRPYDPKTLASLPPSVAEALRTYQGIYRVVLDVAEKENAMRRLLKEIEKTKRRANSIENVLIPRLEATARYIKFRFDELERDSFAMLKTVKRKMEREAAAAPPEVAHASA